MLPILRDLYAPHRGRRLVEPFVGGMSVALGLRPDRALLCDKNEHLVNFYWRLLDARPFTIPMENDSRLYYAHRARFNEIIGGREWSSQESVRVEVAEIFYFLNRTGFNGLSRYNKSGYFNVPFGKYKKITYRRDFSEYVSVLGKWTVGWGDFGDWSIRSDDFAYLDPPYDGTFTGYSSGGFSWEDQVRLAEKFAVHSGPVVASNAATERVIKLYRELGYCVSTTEAPRRISCDGDRTPSLEMIAVKNLDARSCR